MNKKYGYWIGIVFASCTTTASAQSPVSHHVQQFENSRVNVWKTIIYPTIQQTISMHRHEYDRVVVALTSGTLKVKNDKGKVHYLHLKKDKAYYLSKDVPNELHSDQNVSNHPIKVIVIELKG